MDRVYKYSVLGGTFDHLHLGHQKLLDTAFELSENITIGLTLPEMYKHKFLTDSIEDYATREKNLKNYLQKKWFLSRCIIVPIKDVYGTTLEDKKIEAIIATEENLANLILINKKRCEIGFEPLKTFIVPIAKANDGKNITSERIRKGEIDRDGFVYKNVFSANRVLTLPDSLRPELQKPIGEVIKNTKELLKFISNKSIIIAVGDVITDELKKENFTPAISIIDFHSRRQPFVAKFSKEKLLHFIGKKIINHPGTISYNAVNAIEQALNKFLNTNKPQVLKINGEEDLLALPAILLAPLGSVILYGQYGMGIVVNKVTEELKKKIREIVEKF